MGIDGGRIWSGYGPDESLQDVESKCFYALHTGVAFGTERDILTVFLLLILTRVILGGSWGARSLSGGRWLRWVHDVDGGGSILVCRASRGNFRSLQSVSTLAYLSLD